MRSAMGCVGRILFAILGTAGLGCRLHDGASEPPNAPSSAPLGGAPECHTGEFICRDAETSLGCDDGKWQARPCGAASLCVAGVCLSGLDGGGGVALESLLEPLGAGWLNAWTVRGPVTDSELDALDPTRGAPFENDGAPRTRVCLPDGFVSDPSWGIGRAGKRHHVLTGVAFVGSATSAVLRASLKGRVRIWLRGKLLMDREATGSDAPFVDEELIAIDLQAGPNALAVVVTPMSAAPPGVRLRFGTPSGARLDYRWATTHGQQCSLGDLTRATLDNRLAAQALVPRLRLMLDGLAPNVTDLRVLTTSSERAARTGQPTKPPLADVRVARSLVQAGTSLDLRIPFERPGSQQLRVQLGDAEQPSVRTFTLSHGGRVSDRLAKLTETFLHGDLRSPRAAALPESLAEDSRASFEHALRTMVGAAEAGHADASWLGARTDELERMATAIEQGTDPYAGKVGVVHRAYRSSLDGNLQPYVLYVPPSARRAKKPLPLVVVAHGLNHDPALALRIAFGEGPKEDEDRGYATRHLPALPDYGIFVLAPGGFRDAGQRTVGEADVLDALSHVRALYAIDERRIGITGYSLGGTVSFTLPLHYPSLFSAAAPLCGYPNLLSYGDVRLTARVPYEDVMLARRYIRNYAENGVHLPLHIVHGGRDTPQRSAVIADRYRELGYSRLFQIEPLLAHNVWDTAYEKGKMLAWLRLRSRPERPEHVRLTTGELRYDRSYWLRLIARSREEEFVSIDAHYRPKERRFEVKTSGVDAFAINLDGFDAQSARVDGRELELSAGSGERFFMRGVEGFSVATQEPDRSRKKRPHVAGPLDDVLRHRTLVVYGTQLSDETETNRLVAEHWASHDSWSGAHFPVLPDRDITEVELHGASLVLIGRPATNSLTARVAGSLPVTFEDGSLSFRGTKHAGSDVGISLIHPSPFAPDEYVVLHAGVSYEGTLASRHLPRLVPDFAIYDAGVRALRGGELLGTRTVKDAGFFSDDWR